MTRGIRYTDGFKQEAVNQVVVHGYPVLEVSKRLGIANKSLYDWIKKFGKPFKLREEEADLRAEIARLKSELRRSEQERSILKEAAVASSGRCQRLLKALDIKPSMSRRGNCWDNAVAESFFSNLKKEEVRGKCYRTRDDGRRAVFRYIELFYNPKRRHTHNGRVAPTVYEQKFLMK